MKQKYLIALYSVNTGQKTEQKTFFLIYDQTKLWFSEIRQLNAKVLVDLNTQPKTSDKL